ncbi:hypothetical protein [Gracilibacillus sp. JCM 18860]|uniref:hypothetical protein n=1 Tax=Gracilibacillus sp. JCM 18860 TaxID=1306159 RepID=UPI0006D1E8F9
MEINRILTWEEVQIDDYFEFIEHLEAIGSENFQYIGQYHGVWRSSCPISEFIDHLEAIGSTICLIYGDFEARKSSKLSNVARHSEEEA